MRLRESALRKIIRACLVEQVVGYTPPTKGGNSDSGYIGFGDLSVPAPAQSSETKDPEDEEQLSAEEQQLTQQRQGSINKGDAVGANYDARKLQRLRKATG